MKVLLLGENSGLYKYLKQGLTDLGHEVTWASNGDGWKEFKGEDTYIYKLSRCSSFIEKVRNYIYEPLMDYRFQEFDVVQAVSPGVYLWPIVIPIFNRLKKRNKTLYISISGMYYPMYKYWKEGKYGINYQMFYDSPLLLKQYESNSVVACLRRDAIEKVFDLADGLIPVTPFEYEAPYQERRNIRKAIMLPVDLKDIKYSENIIIDNKIVLFHGMNSAESKGSKYIIDAMNIIKQRYAERVECIIADRMPYEKYLNALDKANVIIDQCKSYGYGMNGVISMAKGKVVLSGSEDSIFKYVKKNECPIFNIKPDVNQIVAQLEYIVNNSNMIIQWGEMGREYVSKYHDNVKIAQEYVNTWLGK